MATSVGETLFEQEFSRKPQSDSFTPSVEFDPKSVNTLKNIVADGTGAALDTKTGVNPLISTKTTAGEIPDYFKEFEETLNLPLELEKEDKDYSKIAIETFGPDYAHLKSHEDVYDQSLYRETLIKQLKDSPDYEEYKAVVDGHRDINQLIKDTIASTMKKNFQYTPEAYAAQIDQYFDESGQLNSEGQQIAKNLKGQYAIAKQELEQKAIETAKTKLNETKEYRATLDQEIDTYKPLGIDLPEDLRKFVKQYIATGKSKEQPKTVQERARQEFMQAIVSSPQALLKFAKEIDNRGVQYGVNKASKKFFN